MKTADTYSSFRALFSSSRNELNQQTVSSAVKHFTSDSKVDKTSLSKLIQLNTNINMTQRERNMASSIIYIYLKKKQQLGQWFLNCETQALKQRVASFQVCVWDHCCLYFTLVHLGCDQDRSKEGSIWSPSWRKSLPPGGVVDFNQEQPVRVKIWAGHSVPGHAAGWKERKRWRKSAVWKLMKLLNETEN